MKFVVIMLVFFRPVLHICLHCYQIILVFLSPYEEVRDAIDDEGEDKIYNNECDENYERILRGRREFDTKSRNMCRHQTYCCYKNARDTCNEKIPSLFSRDIA